MWGFSCGEEELLPFQSKGWARLSENGQRMNQEETDLETMIIKQASGDVRFKPG